VKKNRLEPKLEPKRKKEKLSSREAFDKLMKLANKINNYYDPDKRLSVQVAEHKGGNADEYLEKYKTDSLTRNIVDYLRELCELRAKEFNLLLEFVKCSSDELRENANAYATS
jgi:hypothetical protein